jgi:hypothetical protein
LRNSGTSAKTPSRPELQNSRPKKRRRQTVGRRKNQRFGRSLKLLRRRPKPAE